MSHKGEFNSSVNKCHHNKYKNSMGKFLYKGEYDNSKQTLANGCPLPKSVTLEGSYKSTTKRKYLKSHVTGDVKWQGCEMWLDMTKSKC